MSMLEAQCTRCDEIFVPQSARAEDLVHYYSEEQDADCGGLGIIQGQWLFNGELVTPETEFSPLRLLEKHAREMPNCDDPDCEFHHPEGREY